MLIVGIWNFIFYFLWLYSIKVVYLQFSSISWHLKSSKRTLSWKCTITINPGIIIIKKTLESMKQPFSLLTSHCCAINYNMSVMIFVKCIWVMHLKKICYCDERSNWSKVLKLSESHIFLLIVTMNLLPN